MLPQKMEEGGGLQAGVLATSVGAAAVTQVVRERVVAGAAAVGEGAVERGAAVVVKREGGVSAGEEAVAVAGEGVPRSRCPLQAGRHSMPGTSHPPPPLPHLSPSVSSTRAPRSRTNESL